MEKEECSICFFQYDKKNKVPRILRCGHTFCQTCLQEIKIPNKHSISCPNCRMLTENVISTKNLPENETVFQQPPTMFAGGNLNSPYEAAKRLYRESESLMNTGERFLKYLDKLAAQDLASETKILQNYEQEFQKVETLAQTIIQMVTQHKDSLQAKLTESMARQRQGLNDHEKEIRQKKEQTKAILQQIEDEVKVELDVIKDNEQVFMKLQLEEHKNAQQEEALICAQQCSYKDLREGDLKDDEKIKRDEMNHQIQIILEEKISPICSQNDESSNESCHAVHNCHLSKSNNSEDGGEAIMMEVQSFKGAEKELFASLKDDKKRVGQVRTLFYGLNEQFEQMLQFKPISKLQLWQLEFNLLSTYNIFSSIQLEESSLSLLDEIKQLEMDLDLRDYYDIKRPTVVFFNQCAPANCNSQAIAEKANRFMKVMRYDILSQTQTENVIKLPAPKHKSPLNLFSCRAISHPSNNSVFLVDGAYIYLFDNDNEILLQKPSFSQIEEITRQAICYNEGFIYVLGGFDNASKQCVNSCSRYNIVTEKWQLLNPMMFAKMDASACPINEYQIVLIGGIMSSGALTDFVEIYDVRENTWKLFEIGLSSPRRLMSVLSSQKDRVIIIGGLEGDGKESTVVEEIDFIKRNLVNLANLNQARMLCNSFLVNDSIFVFGGTPFSQNKQELSESTTIKGEKYTLRENKWREVSFEGSLQWNNSYGSHSSKLMKVHANTVPAALLYE